MFDREKSPMISVSPLAVHPVMSQINVDDLNIKSILSNQGITINVDHAVDNDEAMIMALGYKPEFKRELNGWSVFAVSFSVLGLLPSIAATFDYQQLVSGVSPVPWLIGLFFVTCVSLSLAEVASAFPVSSGSPYAVSQLSPPKYKAFLTWITCWSNWFCQITAASSVNYSGALMMLALGAYNTPSFKISNGMTYGVTTGIQVVCGVISCLPTKWVSRFSSLGTGINMLFLVVVFVVLLAANDRVERYGGSIPKFNSNSTAWSFNNQTDFPTGIACIMAFLGVIWSMSGYDSPYHLAEECANANVAAPRAIIMTSTAGGLIGFVFMIAISYTIVDIDQIAADPQGLGQPFVTYMTQFLSQRIVNAMTALTIISSFCMGFSCMLAASRVTFAYSRDRMFPFPKIWSTVNPVTRTPINAVILNFIIQQLLLLLMFAGSTAIGAVFSVGGIAGFVSFTMPTLLKITYARNTFKPGPVHLGKFSTPIGAISVAFVLVMIPILCMPTVRGKDLTLDLMNWTSVVYFGPLLIAVVFFVVEAHKWYKGPKSNLDEETLQYSKSYELLEGQEAPVEKPRNSISKESET